MARFNAPSSTTKIINKAGGAGYQASPELTLVSILLTSFLKDQFYRTKEDTIADLVKAVAGVDAKFAAQAAVYARNEFGMRSVSHVVAGEIFRDQRASGEPWVKHFLNKVVFRPDDITEIWGYYQSNVSKGKIPAAMKKGFALALPRFKADTLAKYRQSKKDVKLVDVINMTHPKSTEAIAALVKDELRNANTWEAKVSEAGKTDGNKAEAKAQAWVELVKGKNLKQLALLRNLRNILETAPEVLQEALAQLVDNAGKEAKIFPFQYITAIEEINKLNMDGVKDATIALNQAVDKSCEAIELPGSTAILLDVSGSMQRIGKEVSIMTSILAKTTRADIVAFGDTGSIWNYNPLDSVGTICQNILRDHFQWGQGTNMSAGFRELRKKYNRIFVMSDMQTWMDRGYGQVGSANTAYHEYINQYGETYLYSWDFAGYGELSFPESNVALLAGYSDKIFELIPLVEKDKQAILKEIRKVNFDGQPKQK